MISATSQLASVEAELASTTIETVKQFSLLLNSPGIDAEGWENWWITGWFREFCRSVRFHLCSLSLKCVRVLTGTRISMSGIGQFGHSCSSRGNRRAES